jgi:hypothetical protein
MELSSLVYYYTLVLHCFFLSTPECLCLPVCLMVDGCVCDPLAEWFPSCKQCPTPHPSQSKEIITIFLLPVRKKTSIVGDVATVATHTIYSTKLLYNEFTLQPSSSPRFHDAGRRELASRSQHHGMAPCGYTSFF